MVGKCWTSLTWGDGGPPGDLACSATYVAESLAGHSDQSQVIVTLVSQRHACCARRRLGAASPVCGGIPIVRHGVALVGQAVAPICVSVAVVGSAPALIGEPVSVVGIVFALVGPAFAFVGPCLAIVGQALTLVGVLVHVGLCVVAVASVLLPVLRLARPFGRFATAPGLVRLVCRVGVSAEAACIAAAFDGLPTQLGGLAAGSRDRLLVSRFALVSRLVRCHCPTLVLAAWCGVVVAVSLVWVLGGASCSFSVVYGAVAQVGEGVPVVGEGVPVVGGLVALVRLAFTLVCGGLALVDLAFPFVWVHVSVGPCVWAVLGGSLTPLGLGSQSDREGMALFGPGLAPIVCLLAKAQGGSAEYRPIVCAVRRHLDGVARWHRPGRAADHRRARPSSNVSGRNRRGPRMRCRRVGGAPGGWRHKWGLDPCHQH